MANPEGFAATLTNNQTITRLSNEKYLLQHHSYVRKIRGNGASTTFGLESWKMQGLCGDIKP